MTISGAIFLLLAVQATAGDTAATATQAARPAGERLRDYAAALMEIGRVRDAVNARSATATPSQRDALQREANESIGMILRRYDFDRVSFNAISEAVELRPDVRRQVRQAIMDRVLGT